MVYALASNPNGNTPCWFESGCKQFFIFFSLIKIIVKIRFVFLFVNENNPFPIRKIPMSAPYGFQLFIPRSHVFLFYNTLSRKLTLLIRVHILGISHFVRMLFYLSLYIEVLLYTCIFSYVFNFSDALNALCLFKFKDTWQSRSAYNSDECLRVDSFC